MPKLARWYIKTSLAYLAAALLAGVAMAGHRLLDLSAVLGVFNAAHVHLFVVGWLTQLIFGVAFWLFPRFSKEKPHGNEPLAWGTYVALNAGLLLRAVAEPAVALLPGTGWRAALVVSGLCQWLAGLGFAVYLWPRVRAK